MITFLVSILLISIYGVQVNCKVASYSLNILEKGAMVQEIVEVDVDNQTEVIRVPQHNDVAATETMNDFKENLTVRRIPSTQDCYVSKLDSSIPVPERMDFNMKQVSSKVLRGHHVTTTKRSDWKVVGHANRLTLPQTILDFCGSFPIHNIEQTSVGSMMSSLQKGHRRGKRSHIVSDISTCGEEGRQSMIRCLSKKNEIHRKSRTHVNFNLKCSYETHSCFYVVDCYPVGQGGYECEKIDHFVDYLGYCCNFVC